MQELLKDIEWRVRSGVISPIVRGVQKKIGSLVLKFIEEKPKKSTNSLNDVFAGKRIAIVGNSPILEESGLGSEIDDYDIVIRFNRGICEEYLDYKNTGRKTSFWSVGALDALLARSVRKQLLASKEKVQILVPLQDDEENKAFNIAILELLSPYKELDKFYVSSNLRKSLSNEISSEPSSGILMIKFFLTEAEPKKIGLYGFGFSSKNRISGETYSSQHRFDEEERLVMQWVEQYHHLSLNN